MLILYVLAHPFTSCGAVFRYVSGYQSINILTLLLYLTILFSLRLVFSRSSPSAQDTKSSDANGEEALYY